MPSLNQESTIMSSNDGAITLTTHRLLQRSRDINKEMMLTDFISYEQIRKRSGYYKVLTIVFLVASVIFGVIYNNKVKESETFGGRMHLAFQKTFGEPISINEQLQLYGGLTAFFCFLLAISLIFLLLSNKRYLKIAGKFSTIEFSINYLRNDSYSKFTNALITESDNRKRE